MKKTNFGIAASLCLAVQLTAVAGISLPSWAQDKPALQGSVQKVELSLEKLRDIGLDLKQVLKSASSLYDEVTIQPVSILTEPEVIGRGIVINVPIGTMPVGAMQPARKDRVDQAMAGIKPVITTLKTNVDAFLSGQRQLDMSDDLRTELKPDFDQWSATVNAVASKETQLEQLTQGPKYDNQSIAAVTSAIEKNVKELDEIRRKIYKVVRKQAKDDAKTSSIDPAVKS